MKKISGLWLSCSILALSGCAHHPHPTNTHVHRESVRTHGNDVEAAKANVELAMALLKRGDPSKAKEKLLHARDLAPKEPAVWYGLAYFYEHTGNTALAESHYKNAIKFSHLSPGAAHNNYGTYLCRQKRYQQAISEFITAAEDESYLDVAGAFENAGLCSLDIPNKKQARHFFERALKFDANADVALYYLGKIAFESGDFKQAATYIRHLSAIESPIPQTVSLLAKIEKAINAS